MKIGKARLLDEFPPDTHPFLPGAFLIIVYNKTIYSVKGIDILNESLYNITIKFAGQQMIVFSKKILSYYSHVTVIDVMNGLFPQNQKVKITLDILRIAVLV